jgi:predicted component of type VI protein secretion system
MLLNKIIIIISLLIPTAGAQAFLIDHSQGKRAITHQAALMRIGGCYRLQTDGTNSIGHYKFEVPILKYQRISVDSYAFF